MTDSRKFQIEHQIADRLADLAGIQNDLRLVVRACDLFLNSPIVGSEEAILSSKAIASFAIVTYIRTLNSGVRSGVELTKIEALPEDLQQAHKRFKDIRDGYVAHSLNNMERNVVEITMSNDLSAIESLGTTHSRLGTFSPTEISLLKRLAGALHELVDLEYDSEFDRVWDFIESMPIEARKLVMKHPTSFQPGAPTPRIRRRRGG